MELKESLKEWNVVLASASPRRKELLEQIGIFHDIRPSEVKEEKNEKDPAKLVENLSYIKAADVASGCEAGTLVIGADTVVAVCPKGEEETVILGKPTNVENSKVMIRQIQGHVHQVYTGVTIILCQKDGKYAGSTFSEKTDVEVYDMEEAEIAAYVSTGEPLDKAGAYGIQGSFAAYVKGIHGDYTNVVGLPLGRLCHEIKKLLEAPIAEQ